MNKLKKTGVGCAIFILAIVALSIGGHLYYQPTWNEVYRFQNEEIIVTHSNARAGNNELEQVLVVQVRGITDWSGGWGVSGKEPEAGSECDSSPHELHSVTSYLSDPLGRVPFKRFVEKGYGRSGGISGHTKGGFVKILAYKRGYQLNKESGRMNKIQDSRIRLLELRESSPVKSGVDDILELLCPFDFADAKMQNSYWSHELPGGMTIRDYAISELDAILQKDIDDEEKLLIHKAIERIRAEKFDGYPTNTYQLTKP